jgi:hypothetical protein
MSPDWRAVAGRKAEPAARANALTRAAILIIPSPLHMASLFEEAGIARAPRAAHL